MQISTVVLTDDISENSIGVIVTVGLVEHLRLSENTMRRTRSVRSNKQDLLYYFVVT